MWINRTPTEKLIMFSGAVLIACALGTGALNVIATAPAGSMPGESSASYWLPQYLPTAEHTFLGGVDQVANGTGRWQTIMRRGDSGLWVPYGSFNTPEECLAFLNGTPNTRCLNLKDA